MKKINWLLISEIHSTLKWMQRTCDWDLDNYEISKLSKSIYVSLQKHIPKSDQEWIDLIEQAYCACWGRNHKCDKVTQDELDAFKQGFPAWGALETKEHKEKVNKFAKMSQEELNKHFQDFFDCD